MRLIALMLVTLTLANGCRSNINAADSAPLSDADWRLAGEPAPLHGAAIGLSDNTAGDLLYAYQAAGSGESHVWRVSATGHLQNCWTMAGYCWG